MEQVVGLEDAIGFLESLKVLKLQLANCSALDSLETLGSSLSRLVDLRTLDLDVDGCENLCSIKYLGEGIASLNRLKDLKLNMFGCYELPSSREIVDAIIKLNMNVLHLSLPPAAVLGSITKLKDFLVSAEITSFYLGLAGCDMNLPRSLQKNFDNVQKLHDAIEKVTTHRQPKSVGDKAT